MPAQQSREDYATEEIVAWRHSFEKRSYPVLELAAPAQTEKTWLLAQVSFAKGGLDIRDMAMN